RVVPGHELDGRASPTCTEARASILVHDGTSNCQGLAAPRYRISSAAVPFFPAAQQLTFCLQLTPRRSVGSNRFQVCPPSVVKSLPVRPTVTAVSLLLVGTEMLVRKPA